MPALTHPAYSPGSDTLLVLGVKPLSRWAFAVHAAAFAAAVASFGLIDGVAAGVPILFLLVLWANCALAEYFCPLLVALESDALVMVRQGWLWPWTTTMRIPLSEIVYVSCDGMLEGRRGVLVCTRHRKRYPIHFVLGQSDHYARFSLHVNATEIEFPAAPMDRHECIAAFCAALERQNVLVREPGTL